MRKKRVVYATGITQNAAMNNTNSETSQKHYQTVTKALHYLKDRQLEQPSLEQLAGQLQLSPAYLQRVFQSWAGVSPKQFLSHLTREAALERLKTGATVFDAALDSGLSGSGRLHDLLIHTDAITPGQARKAGKDLQIQWGFFESPFGKTLLAWTDRGLAFLGFSSIRGKQHAINELQLQWPLATLSENPVEAEVWGMQIFNRDPDKPLPVWLSGSPFQLKVWEALLKIPVQANVSYADLAIAAGKPKAARAIGTAVGRNPISLLIPCHRVIRKMGVIGEYRWGTEIKMSILARENSNMNTMPGIPNAK